MRRREFITLVSGAAAAWPLAAQAQQVGMKRIAVLSSIDDPVEMARYTVFRQGLQQLGWTDGVNVKIDVRSGTGDADSVREKAAQLVALTPDVILASASASVAALQRVTRTVPIVFANVIDPVGAGFVANLAHPGGNTTGFTAFEYNLRDRKSVV